MIQVIRELTKETYDGEDDATKAEVAKKLAEQASQLDDEDRNEELPRTAQEYQEYVIITDKDISLHTHHCAFSALLTNFLLISTKLCM
jgi:hypothetical protein